MNTRISWILAGLATALIVGATSAAFAADDDGKRAEWVRKYQSLQLQHAQLEQELEEAKIDYSRGRSRKRLRGEGKAGLVEEIARLEEEFDKVDQELANFPNEARKQGALPGWFRDLEPPVVAPQGAQPAAASDSEPDEDSETMSSAQRRAAERKNRRLGGQ
jgi:hypothetical protein